MKHEHKTDSSDWQQTGGRRGDRRALRGKEKKDGRGLETGTTHTSYMTGCADGGRDEGLMW